MLVKNNEARVHKIGNHCKLGPGINMVKDAEWAKARKIPTVQFYLENGSPSSGGKKILEEVKTRAGKSDFTSFTDSQQADMVADCFDLDLLNEWGQVAKGKVSKVIDAKIVEMKKKLEEKKGS